MLPSFVLSQSKTISGVILNKKNRQPVDGAVIRTADRGINNKSDNKGRFQLVLPDSVEYVVVSHIGFVDSIIHIYNFSGHDMQLFLQEQEVAIEEIIVNTGYSRIPAERSTGSFNVIDRSVLEQRTGASILSRIEGTATGLLMNKEPSPPFTVRGINSLSADLTPLVVVDNFEYHGDLENINPNDIESVSILKDAAAASIWGARAGNGVIVITTKSGKAGQGMRIGFNLSQSITVKPDVGNIKAMSPKDFISVEKMLFEKGYYDVFINDPLRGPFTPVVELLYANKLNLLSDADLEERLAEQEKYTLLKDFEKYWFRSAHGQQYNTNISGGSDRSDWYLSLGHDQSKNTLSDRNHRTSIRIKNSFRPIEKIVVSSDIAISNTGVKFGRESYENTVLINGGQKYLYPYARFLDKSGEAVALVNNFRKGYVDTAGNGNLLDWNYYPLLEQDANRKERQATDIVINAAVNYKPLKILELEGRYQYGKQFFNSNFLSEQDAYFSRNMINSYAQLDSHGKYTFPVPKGGILDTENMDMVSNSFRFQANLNIDSDKHRMLTLIGTEMGLVSSRTTSDRIFGYNDKNKSFSQVDLLNSYSQYYYTAIKIPIFGNSNIYGTNKGRVSYYMNGSYSYDNRYIVTVSARKDQSNLFGANTNQKAVPLWSVGSSWDILREDFVNISSLNNLRLRTTYGVNGNMDKGTSAHTVISMNRGTEGYPPYASISRYGNPDLRWEKIRTLNIAIDFSTKANILSGKVEYFEKKITDMTSGVPVDYTSGITTVTKNSSTMFGRGLEVEFQGNLNLGKIKYQPSVLMSWVSNKIDKSFIATNLTASSYVSGSGQTRIPGRSPYSVLSYRWAGLNPENGNPRGYLNGDISESYAAIINQTTLNDLVYNGSSIPTVFGALRNNILWKDFAFYFNLSFKGGYYFRKKSIRYGTLYANWLGHSDFADRWQKPGDENNTDIPSMEYPLSSTQRDNFYVNSDATVLSADHIRLQDVGFSWRLQKLFSNGISNFQLYGVANNLGIIWRKNKQGLDPDALNNIRQRYTVSLGVRFNL